MIRLYDRIRSGEYKLAPYDVRFFSPAHWESCAANIREELASAEMIVADNIDDFVFSTYPVEKGYGLSPKEIPNLVPPFGRFFIDIRPADPYVKNKMKEIGALVTALEIPEDSPRRTQFGPEYKPRFLFALRAFFRLDRVVYVTLAQQVVISDENGDMLDSEILTDPQIDKAAQLSADGSGILSMLSAPVLTAISFLNCRNVRADLHSPDPDLSRAYRKKTGTRWGLTKYRVIDIIPMSKLIREAVASGSNGSAGERASHIVRGHFKRYAEGSGLFGKLHGTYFWASQARGSLAHGDTKNTYRIRTDGEGRR